MFSLKVYLLIPTQFYDYVTTMESVFNKPTNGSHILKAQ